jgi:O-antigen/teichoic acid export membrane protein
MSEVENPISFSEAEAAVLPVLADRVHREGDIRQLASGASVFLAGRFLGRGVRFLGDIALAHILGPSRLGLFAIGWTLTRIITLLSPMGLDAGVVRFGTRYWESDSASFRGVLLWSLLFALLSGLSIGAAVFLAAPWLAATVFHKEELTGVFRAFGFAMPLIATLRVAASSTRISKSMKYAVLSEDMSQPVTFLFLFLALSWIGWRLEGALEAMVLSFGIALLLALMFMWKIYPEVRATNANTNFPGMGLLAFSLPATISATLGMLIMWVDRLFVGHYRSAAETGVYQSVSQLSISLAVILGSFASIFSPMTAVLHHRGEMKRLEEVFRVSTKWSLYVSIPPFLVMCFASREVLSVLFGKPYAIGWATLIILGVGQLVNAGTGPVTGLLVMAGLQNHLFLISGVSLGAGAAMCIFLIPRWGMAGAAVATAVSIIGMFAWSIYVGKQRLNMLPYDRRYLKGLAAAAAAVGGLLLLRQFNISSPVMNLVAVCTVATTVFAAALMLGGLDEEDRDFIKMLRARLKAKETAYRNLVE